MTLLNLKRVAIAYPVAATAQTVKMRYPGGTFLRVVSGGNQGVTLRPQLPSEAVSENAARIPGYTGSTYCGEFSELFIDFPITYGELGASLPPLVLEMGGGTGVGVVYVDTKPTDAWAFARFYHDANGLGGAVATGVPLAHTEDFTPPIQAGHSLVALGHPDIPGFSYGAGMRDWATVQAWRVAGWSLMNGAHLVNLQVYSAFSEWTTLAVNAAGAIPGGPLASGISHAADLSHGWAPINGSGTQVKPGPFPMPCERWRLELVPQFTNAAGLWQFMVHVATR